MTRITTLFTILLISSLTWSVPLLAQETAAEPESATASQAETSLSEESSYELRSNFTRLMQQYPPELASILKLDPTLLSNEAFLEGYPALQEFVRAHPQVSRNPRFFLAHVQVASVSSQSDELRLVSSLMEGLTIAATILGLGLIFIWLVKTTIEQRRWGRMSKLQSEVHNKILDRFSSNDELLRYMQTKAGQRFLESAPIPVRTDDSSVSAPVNRVLWSIQIGLVIGATAIGLIVVSYQFEEAAQSLFSLGVIALCVGVGFIASGFASVALSRKLGVWKPTGADEITESGLTD